MTEPLDRQISSYIKKLGKIKNIEVPRANAKVLNTIGKRSTRRIIGGISKQTRIPQKVLRMRTYIGRATSGQQRVKLTGYAAPISAVNLLTKAQKTKIGKGTNKQGVTAKGYRWKGAFIARGLSDNLHVFKRTGVTHRPSKGNYKGQTRDEIDAIKIPVNKEFRRAMKVVPSRLMNSDYKRLLQHELKFRLKKYEAK